MGETSVRPGWDTGDWSGLPPVTIHPYDPGWPARYEQAQEEIARALADLDVQIEHVGSTAVPGLGARQGIDILIGLGAESAGVEACVARLQEIGYRYHFSEPGWTHLSGNGCKLHLTPIGSTSGRSSSRSETTCAGILRPRPRTTSSSSTSPGSTVPTARGTSTTRRRSCAPSSTRPAARKTRGRQPAPHAS